MSNAVHWRQGDETLPLSEHNPFSAMWGLDSSVPTYQRSLRTVLSSACWCAESIRSFLDT